MNIPLPVVTNCNGCGACCTGQAGLPASWYVGTAGPLGPSASGKPLPAKLIGKLRAIVRHWLKHGFPDDGSPCIWYDATTRRCRHYEYRPTVCRDLRVGDEACLRWREKLGVAHA